MVRDARLPWVVVRTFGLDRWNRRRQGRVAPKGAPLPTLEQFRPGVCDKPRSPDIPARPLCDQVAALCFQHRVAPVGSPDGMEQRSSRGEHGGGQVGWCSWLLCSASLFIIGFGLKRSRRRRPPAAKAEFEGAVDEAAASLLRPILNNKNRPDFQERRTAQGQARLGQRPTGFLKEAAPFVRGRRDRGVRHQDERPADERFPPRVRKERRQMFPIAMFSRSSGSK